ncbi:SAF domain-containing protein [Pseudonocardia sp. GCM10023141]|uniref:SAF domain-containing protein n=1 Tax=Pseudonocardia sp. GCM10023141 TaxID=3252653 RepID=UPI00360DEB38
MTTTAEPRSTSSGLASVPKLRAARRPRLLLFGLVLAVLGALAGVLIVRQTNSREEIIMVTREVPFGQVIAREDLTTASLPQGTGLATIAFADVDTVIGRSAATDLLVGQPLSPAAVAAAAPPSAGFAVVGIAVANGRAPVTPLNPRDQVLVVGTGEGAAPIAATVLRAGDPDAAGKRVVDLLVAEGVAVDLVRAAADDHAALVLTARR